MLTIRPETLISRYASAANKVAERFNISLDMALQKIAEFKLCHDWTDFKNKMTTVSRTGFGLTRFELCVVCLSIVGKQAPEKLIGKTLSDYFLDYLDSVLSEGAEDRIKMARELSPQLATDSDPLIPIIKKFRNMATEDLIASTILIGFLTGKEWATNGDAEMFEAIRRDQKEVLQAFDSLVDVDPLERYDSAKLVIIDSEDLEQTLN